ncbi:MAG: DNA polymerase subunit beta [Candidatus Lokiarchaeota archaeon]|nr:DNA polymerase subunit beta [Candidatus Lokiarchaeota archaeon]
MDKILRNHNRIIKYKKKDWELLKSKRLQALKLLDLFVMAGFNPYIYGSLARGDVHIDSDIDIVFLKRISSFLIEHVLFKNGYNNYFREIVMATPGDTIKLYIYLSELESITIPISSFDKKSLEFYSFGGKINQDQIKREIRVPGIDKRLVFIKPTSNGHEESSILGNEHNVAKEINVNIETIMERRNVLLRREQFGRTGVFLKRPLNPDESTENVLKTLARKKTIIRKKLREI